MLTAAGAQVSRVTNSASGVSGVTSGPLDISFDVNTSSIGTFNFQVFVTDARGANSNTLSGSFGVRDIWQQKANMPTPRDGLAVAAVNNKIYAIGGNTSTPAFLDGMEVYDQPSDTWALGKAMPGGARSESAAAVVNGKIYIIGGIIGGATFSAVNRVEEYDPATDTWTAKAPMPTARGEVGAAVVNGKIYAVGGHFYPPGEVTPVSTNVVEEYDPATNTWRTVAAMPTARAALAVVAVNNRIYAIGGGSAAGPSFTNAVEEYNPATNTWTVKAPLPTARYDLAADVVNGKIYTIGGFSGGLSGGIRSHDIIEEYDPTTNTWNAKAYLYPPGRHDLGVAVVSGKIYAIGGEANTERYLNRVDEYNPANDI